MQDPFAVLGIEHDAADDQIRRRYLELVRQFPPEREPGKAAEIRAAYDALRDPIARLESRLFDVKSSQTFDSLIGQLQPDLCADRLPTRLLMSLRQS